MDDYFVSYQPPRPSEPDREADAPPERAFLVEQLDFSSRPPVVPNWLRGLALGGQVLLVLGMLLVAMLPVIGIMMFFQFIESLPW